MDWWPWIIWGLMLFLAYIGIGAIAKYFLQDQWPEKQQGLFSCLTVLFWPIPVGSILFVAGLALTALLAVWLSIFAAIHLVIGIISAFVLVLVLSIIAIVVFVLIVVAMAAILVSVPIGALMIIRATKAWYYWYCYT